MSELTYTRNGDYLIPDLSLTEQPQDVYKRQDLDDYDYGEDEYEFEPYEDEPEQDTTEDTDA